MTEVRRIKSPHIGVLASGAQDANDTLVFLHGWSGSKEQWWHALTDLGAQFRCVALDLPGTGDSRLSPSCRTMRDMAHWVAEVCHALQIKTMTLVGHSLGGNLAAQTALDFPGIVNKLVLVDAALETAYLPRRVALTISPRYGLTALKLLRASAMPMSAFGKRVPYHHHGSALASYARRMHFYTSNNADDALQRQVSALMANSLDADALSKLTAPILMVHGRYDHIVPLARAQALVNDLPNATLRVFPTSFHCPMDTDPRAFADVLQEFVSS